ncbi:endonuclease III domain-containing protein [Novosphingopyxis sp. YJ-S2-01]|uniref:endonuclease III domain-containing protein n=1 Tax=Novosphingopyxis sp. YJ-S2-01 TaxID=2794021 RepID=UPI0018DCA977|nr:endonuclease III [Novosphingopyxis sp. YJ-S2-01]MBH9538401.1 endonuclease III [Novosphingopyxis sp. YJ-S2-01]
MELALGGDPRTDVLRRLHAALIARFGQIERQHEKRVDPVWTLVQGVIGARSKTAISNAATDRLLQRFGTWEAVATAHVETLTDELRTQTFPAQSAERLKACLQAIMAERGEVDLRHLSNLPTEDAMAWLERLPGVARKISAGIMNTSRFQRRAIVIDSHHRRIVQRMGLVPPKADTTRAYDALMPILPDEWSAADIDEHHLLVKKLGQTLCRPSEMLCADCPARPDCATGRASLEH